MVGGRVFSFQDVSCGSSMRTEIEQIHTAPARISQCIKTPVTRFLSKQMGGYTPSPHPQSPLLSSPQSTTPIIPNYSLSPRTTVSTLTSSSEQASSSSSSSPYTFNAQVNLSPQQLPPLIFSPSPPPPSTVDRMSQPFTYNRSISCPSDTLLGGGSSSIYPYPPTPPLYSQLLPSRLNGGSASGRPPESFEIIEWLNKPNPRQWEDEYCNSPRVDLVESGGEYSGRQHKKEKRSCTFPQCSSYAVTMGKCIAHGGGRRCTRKGCTRGAQSKNLCVAHGGGRICNEIGCSNIQRSQGKCIRHGGGKRCCVPGCEKGVVRQDLCTAHGGKRKCKVDGCTKHVKKKGLCRSHAKSMFPGIGV